MRASDHPPGGAWLWLEELRWDAQFGSCVVRPSAERDIRQRLAEALARLHHAPGGGRTLTLLHYAALNPLSGPF
jgi:hypothetical protein